MKILNFKILFCCLSIAIVNTHDTHSSALTSCGDNNNEYFVSFDESKAKCGFYINYCTFSDKICGVLSHEFKVNLNEVDRNNIMSVYSTIVKDLILKLDSYENSIKEKYSKNKVLKKQLIIDCIKDELPKFNVQDFNKYNILKVCNSDNEQTETLINRFLDIIKKTSEDILYFLHFVCLCNGNIYCNEEIKQKLQNTMSNLINEEKLICSSAQETVTDFCKEYYSEYTTFSKRSGLKNNSYYNTYIDNKKITNVKKCYIEQFPFNFAYALTKFKYSNNNQKELIFSSSIQQNAISYEIPRNDLLKQSVSSYEENIINNEFYNARNALFKIIRQYNNYVGKSQILDNEFKILYNIVMKSDEISKRTNENINIKSNETIKSNNVEIKESQITNGNCKKCNMNIDIFTFMDMCPSCWTAWKKMFPYIKSLYKKLLNINELELQVSVYSIKPFYDKYHFFIGKYNELNNIKNVDFEHIRVEDWVKTQLPYRRYNGCTNNSSACFSQSVDVDGVQIIQEKLKEEHNKILENKDQINNMNIETSINKNNIININEDLEEGKVDNFKKDKEKYNNDKQFSNNKKKIE